MGGLGSERRLGPSRAPWATVWRRLSLRFLQLLPLDGEFVLASGAGFSASLTSSDPDCSSGERAGPGRGRVLGGSVF